MDTLIRIAIALPLGLVFGSFLTVAVYRAPRKESLVAPRSRCPSCGRQLRNVDNVPVLSWLVLRGRCHWCGARISPIYPLVELATGGLFVAAALTFEEVWLAVLMAPFLALLFALAVIDIGHKLIPNVLVYPAFVVAGVFLVVARLLGADVNLAQAGIGVLAYGGFLLVVALVSPGGMGMGDVKLAALIGLVLGAIDLDHVLVAAGLGILIGGVAALVALLAGAGRKTALPFGPFLAAGAVLAAFFGAPLADLYLRSVG